MVLRLEGVKKSFRNNEELVPVLQGVSFELEASDTLALRGESGSGKSTLLHISGALEAADAGRVWVSGKELTQLNDGQRAQLRRTDIALIFQRQVRNNFRAGVQKSPCCWADEIGKTDPHFRILYIAAAQIQVDEGDIFGKITRIAAKFFPFTPLLYAVQIVAVQPPSLLDLLFDPKVTGGKVILHINGIRHEFA